MLYLRYGCVFELLLANVVHVRYLLSPVRLSVVCRSSVVCNVRAPYSGGSDFREYFYGIRYLGHPLTSTEKFHGDRPRGTPPPGELNTRGVAKYSDFGPIDGYIPETVQDIGGKLVLITNRKSYMSFRLVPKSVTLTDLERRNGRYFCVISANSGSFRAHCVKVNVRYLIS